MSVTLQSSEFNASSLSTIPQITGTVLSGIGGVGHTGSQLESRGLGRNSTRGLLDNCKGHGLRCCSKPVLTPLSMVCVWHSVPSAAGMLLVMQRLLLLRHHSSLQTSCRTEETSQAHRPPQACLGGPSTLLGLNDPPSGSRPDTSLLSVRMEHLHLL